MNSTLQTYKNWFIDTPFEYLKNNPEIRLYLVVILALLLTLWAVYTLWIIIRLQSDKNKQIHRMEVRFPIPTDQNQEFDAIASFQAFLSSCHSLLESERMSLEMHRVDEYITLLITTSHQQALGSISKFLSGVEGVSIYTSSIDLLDAYRVENKLSIRRLYLTRSFDPINQKHIQSFADIANYLASLESDLKGGVVFVLRPAFDKTDRIKKVVGSNSQTISTSPKLAVQKENENSGLVEKAQYKLYFSNIYVIGSNPSITRSLSAHLKGADGNNRFVSVSALFPKRLINKLQRRYVSFENLYTRYFRSFYGSFFSTQELAQLFHPSIIKRGSYGTNRSVVVEANPTFFEQEKGSTLVGSTHLKTGEKKEIYLPASSRRRHTYALGSTGSGKSTTLINSALSVISEGQSALIFFDPNGMDIKNIIRRLSPQELANRVVYLDPAHSSRTITLNPFIRGFGASRVEKDALVENIFDIFEQNAKDGDLGTSIKKLLKVLITTGVWFPDYYYNKLIEMGMSEVDAKQRVMERQITLADLPYLLSKNFGFRDLLSHIFAEGDDNIAVIWQRHIDTYNTTPSVLDGIDNRLANITTDSILPMLEGSRFDIVEAVKQKKIILIPNTEPLYGVKGKKLLPQLLMTELWAELQREQNSENKEKVVVIIDEVEEVQLPIIVTMLAQARKYGLSLILANQYLFQLHDWFTKAILGNVANLFIFKMRNRDEVKYITPLFGGYVQDSDITGLEKFQGYLTTLNDKSSRSGNIMSFETIDYTTHYPELSTDKDISALARDSLERYGEDRKTLEINRKQKIEDPEGWFLG